MSRAVARPSAALPTGPVKPVRIRAAPASGPHGAQRTAMRAQLDTPMDDTTRRMIASVAREGLDAIVQARLLAMGLGRDVAPRRKRQP